MERHFYSENKKKVIIYIILLVKYKKKGETGERIFSETKVGALEYNIILF